MSENSGQQQAGCGAITVGGFIAVLMSWSVNNSIIYAFLHGVLGWLYVLYWMIVHYKNVGGEIPW